MTSWREGPLGLARPALALRPHVDVPPSKSAAIRALLLAAGGCGGTRIAPLTEGDDVRQAVDAAAFFAERVEQRLGVVTVHGRRGLSVGTGEVKVGESGTLARLAIAMAALALGGGPTRIEVAGSLARRRSPALFKALSQCGARFEWEGEEAGFQVTVFGRARGDQNSLHLVDPSSSQELSAVLIASACCGALWSIVVEGTVPSRPYVDLTLNVLREFGVEVEEWPTKDRLTRFEVAGGIASVGDFVVEPDASLAAVPLAAACLVGGEVSVPHLSSGSAQGDVHILDHLAAFGCSAHGSERGLRAGGCPTQGADLDLSGEPDLAPVIAAMAAAAALRHHEASRITGLETLPLKESDRLSGCANALRLIGCRVLVEGAELRVGPGGARSAKLTLDPKGDHRMAYLHALLGLIVPGVRTAYPNCVSKTWPAFWSDMEALGFEVVAGA